MRQVKQNEIYKHFKGDYYIILEIGKDAETMEDCVIYRSLYEEGKVWIRPLDNFLEEVDHKKYPNINQKYKFELQEIKSRRNK